MQQKPQAVASAKLITVYINKNNLKPEQTIPIQSMPSLYSLNKLYYNREARVQGVHMLCSQMPKAVCVLTLTFSFTSSESSTFYH